MQKFRFLAKDKRGRNVAGVVEARDEKQALALLKKRDLFVLEITLLKPKFWEVFSRISKKQITTFTRQLATMVNAGLPLIDALNLLEQQSSGKFRQVLQEIITQVEGGAPLYEALKKH